MVTSDSIQQRRLQRNFDSFCKTVLRNKARNIIYRETDKQNKRMILLSALTQD